MLIGINWKIEKERKKSWKGAKTSDQQEREEDDRHLKEKNAQDEGSKGEKEKVYNKHEEREKTEASKSETINPDRFAKSEVSREFSVSCPRSENSLAGVVRRINHHGPANPGIYPFQDMWLRNSI